VFFQPSGQGYEKLIRESVLSHREAQVEAMIESESDNALEAASATSKPSVGEWARRTSGSSGDLLSRVRSRLFELAGVNRDSLVLDLQARTGLLAFAAGRKATHGAVWALAHDRKTFDALTAMARPLDELERPQVLAVSWDDFDRKLAEAAGAEVKFTAIVGRNAVARQQDPAALLRRAALLLHEKGVIALAETVPSMGQRISALCDLGDLPPKLVNTFKKAEEEVFSDPSNPAVNWDVTSLSKVLNTVEGIDVQSMPSEEMARRRITPSDVDHWFRTTAAGEQVSLGERLRKMLDEKEVDKLRAVLHRQLDNRDVSWKTVVGYWRGTKH
jgi:putative ATPase